MQAGPQLGQRTAALLHLHLDRDLVGVMGVLAEVGASPVAELRSTAGIRHLSNGAEDVAIEFEDFLAQQKL